MSLETLAFDLAFAFSAGVFSIFSPCSFPLLPGYIAYMVGSKASGKKAALVGCICTLGFLTVFTILGVIAASVGSIFIEYLPWLQLIAAILIIFFGLTLLLDISLPLPTVSIKASESLGLLSMYTFGLTYGLASTCTAPIFFSVVLYAFVGGILSGIATSLAYSLGMGFVFILLTILTVEAKRSVVQKISTLTPLIRKLSGLVLITVGIYMVYVFISS